MIILRLPGLSPIDPFIYCLDDPELRRRWWLQGERWRTWASLISTTRATSRGSPVGSARPPSRGTAVVWMETNLATARATPSRRAWPALAFSTPPTQSTSPALVNLFWTEMTASACWARWPPTWAREPPATWPASAPPTSASAPASSTSGPAARRPPTTWRTPRSADWGRSCWPPGPSSSPGRRPWARPGRPAMPGRRRPLWPTRRPRWLRRTRRRPLLSAARFRKRFVMGGNQHNKLLSFYFLSDWTIESGGD